MAKCFQFTFISSRTSKIFSVNITENIEHRRIEKEKKKFVKQQAESFMLKSSSIFTKMILLLCPFLPYCQARNLASDVPLSFFSTESLTEAGQ